MRRSLYRLQKSLTGGKPSVLVLNCGSSSLKYMLTEVESERELVQGTVDSVTTDHCFIKESGHGIVHRFDGEVDHGRALDHVMQDIRSRISEKDLVGVGHRVVHGGQKLYQPTLVTPEVLESIRDCVPLAPLHNPANIEGIERAQSAFPDVPQVAVFDTGFHHSIPDYASLYAIPYEVALKHRVRRYGFHGISHEYVGRRAAKMMGIPFKRARLITLHLGNGCSATSIRQGCSQDTTMGMTPLDGLIMGTRAGQLDPGIESYLCRQMGLTIDEVETMLNKKSGLLGVSGVSSDMRVLSDCARRRDGSEESRRSQLAIDMFVYRLCRHISALMVSLWSRCDAIVFTGGIGENSVYIRREVCERLKFLGIFLEDAYNEDFKPDGWCITSEDSPMAAYVVPTKEELQIKREVQRVLELSDSA
eukprot:TRINITY_DN22919_c0_g1_i1.p1 TRINITY_DN22919_c0_g1~~TRINITY_DN22919_c0_g1_i1.p1  ORF type:complete len:448 (+),score=132.35 TRINITY_DN22919_c0_g1_i1:89-1345(+)